MATRSVLSLLLLLSLCFPSRAAAAQADLASVIEGFMAREFPGAHSHMWIINSADYPAANELVVDLNTIVVPREREVASENRFLLLIVEGHLTATQNIPLDSKTDCKPDSA